MSNRRKFLVGLGAAAFSPQALLAQVKTAPMVVGWLHPGSRAAAKGGGLADFKERMAELGWKEGSSYVLEERWADAQPKRLPALAVELETRKPAVIVAVLPPAVIAAAKAAPKVPVVQVQGDSPVNSGLAASLARPGGMVTGITNLIAEVSAKYLELLLDAAPRLKRIGFLVDSSSETRIERMETARRSAARYSVDVRFAEVASRDKLGAAVSYLATEGVQALVVLPGTWFTGERRQIMKLALEQRWPVIAGPASFAEEGALLTYSADARANFRRSADYVDRILKGAKPGDLPIEQPTKFDLIVNMKTARALGLEIAPAVMSQATRVIE